MKTGRILATVIVALGTLTATITAASAQTTYPPSLSSGPSSVLGAGGETNAGPAGTAFTGSDITVAAALFAVALLIVGVVGVYLARRRAA